MTQKGGWRIWVAQRFEDSLLNSGFLTVIKDGSDNKEQSSVRTPLDKPSFYTKTYRVVLDGEPVNMVLKFVYNLRDGYADFDFHYKRFPDGRTVSKVNVEQRMHSLSVPPREAK